MVDTIDKASAAQRAARCWELMTQNEKDILRFGMSPHWSIQEDLGGKAKPEECFEEAKGDSVRLLAVALMDIADKNGGMVV